MNIWQIILNIVIFLLSLSVLVCLHEAGHLTAAKIFKVYCYEFSIGMGPAIYSKKPNKEKGQETKFSIRCAPIGGYVSMAGEDLENVEGVDKSIVVPKDRTLEAKARWKQVIIMFAGVFMNFVIGYVLLVISYGCCTQAATKYDWNKIQVTSNSIIEKSQVPSDTNFRLETNDVVVGVQINYYVKDSDNKKGEVVDSIPYTDIYCYQSTDFDINDPKEEYNHQMSFVLSNRYFDVTTSKVKQYTISSLKDYREVTFYFTKSGDTNNIVHTTLVGTDVQDSIEKGFQTMGITSAYYYFNYTPGEAFGKAWDRWCYSCSALVSGVVGLFNPANWNNVGGIISIFKLSSQATTIGIGTYLNFWALISVNLAIMNLLPFPGLDGWQILVTIGEGCYFGGKKLAIKAKNKAKKLTKEEIEQQNAEIENKSIKHMATYKKVKNIMSYIGMGLLIVLMVVLIVKDIVAPAI
jgi:regulator of sigma E protease